MGYTTRLQTDGTHPLCRFLHRLRIEQAFLEMALERDRQALRVLSGPGLPWAEQRAVRRQNERDLHRWPLPWKRWDEERFRCLNPTEEGVYTDPGGRTAYLLKRFRGPNGGEPPLLRCYREAQQWCEDAGRGPFAAQRIDAAYEAHTAAVEAVRQADDFNGTGEEPYLQAAREAAGKLFTMLPLPKPEPQPATPKPEPKGKRRGPTLTADEERLRFRIAWAWARYNEAWPEWKAKQGLKGNPRKDVAFYDWCGDNGIQIPKVTPTDLLEPGHEWHTTIENAIHAVKTHLKRHHLTLEQYRDDLNRRGVL